MADDKKPDLEDFEVSLQQAGLTDDEVLAVQAAARLSELIRTLPKEVGSGRYWSADEMQMMTIAISIIRDKIVGRDFIRRIASERET